MKIPILFEIENEEEYKSHVDTILLSVPQLSFEKKNYPPSNGYYFVWRKNGLSLHLNQRFQTTTLHADFLHGSLGYRLRNIHGELITKAVGCRRGFRPAIFDATVGLGQDAGVLASIGCSVSAFEKNPLVAALLMDGLRRAEYFHTWVKRLTVFSSTSLTILAKTPHGVIYLDPMFDVQRNAASKKKMHFLEVLLSENVCSKQSLLEAALDSKASRIVVKRHRDAPFLDKINPNSSIHGAGIRFDLYCRKKISESDLIPFEINSDDVYMFEKS